MEGAPNPPVGAAPKVGAGWEPNPLVEAFGVEAPKVKPFDAGAGAAAGLGALNVKGAPPDDGADEAGAELERRSTRRRRCDSGGQERRCRCRSNSRSRTATTTWRTKSESSYRSRARRRRAKPESTSSGCCGCAGSRCRSRSAKCKGRRAKQVRQRQKSTKACRK